MGKDQKITAEDVITKLKDDGDFDRLRIKIIRQLKQNEDLRNNIISVVKQSAALNRPGAENLKPRELCDAIHDEIRENTSSQISDGLWEIIRSRDGMKSEITETVQSVYDKLLNPHRRRAGESTSPSGQVPDRGRVEFNGPVMVSGESNGTMSNGEHTIPPSFVLNNHDLKSETQKPRPGSRRSLEQGRESHQYSNSPLQNKDGDSSPHPGCSSSGKRKRASGGHDEDPDIPPGFG